MLRFQGVKHLISWLERSPEGRELLREQLARMEARPAPRVLAVQHANRTDLYASEPVRFRVVTQVHSTDHELESESLLEKELPSVYREMIVPGRPTSDYGGYVGSVSNRRLTIGEYEWQKLYRGIVSDVEDFGKRLKEEDDAEKTSHHNPGD